MRKIPKPTFDPTEIFDACVSGVGNAATKADLQALRDSVAGWDTAFSDLADRQQLFTVPSVPRGQPNTIVVGRLTKKQFVDLYELQMAKLGRPARTYYDKILADAPHRKCPLCGFGQATTLDHYLVKSRFPKYSVTPINLVPSCRDCQSEKHADIASVFEDQPLHPYFDPDRYFTRRWLFARVLQGPLPGLTYYVDPQGIWLPPERARLETHFKVYGLNRRYGIEAAEELTSLRDTFKLASLAHTPATVSATLADAARKHLGAAINSWRAAMYDALHQDAWYCTDGYKI